MVIMTTNFMVFAEEVHALAMEKGFMDKPRSFGDKVALLHAEVSEMLEEYCRGKKTNDIYWVSTGRIIEACGPDEVKFRTIDTRKPEGIPIEAADILLRLLTLCVEEGIDLDKALELKMAFNRTRDYRHGNKVLG